METRLYKFFGNDLGFSNSKAFYRLPLILEIAIQGWKMCSCFHILPYLLRNQGLKALS